MAPGVLDFLKKVMAFVLIYLQGKVLEEEKCSFQAGMLMLQFIVQDLKEEFSGLTCLKRNGLVKEFKGTSEMNVARLWNGLERKHPRGSVVQLFCTA